MDFTHLLHMYGYIIIFLITSITFSTGLVLAGFAAQQHYLNVYWIMIIACVGSFIFTEIYFIISRFGFNTLLARHPKWSVKREEVRKRFKSKKGVLMACLLFRFIPGFRIMMPLLLGPLKVSFLFFSVCNFMGSVVWAVFFVFLGFYFGEAAGLFIKNMKQYEGYALIVIVVLAVLYWLVRRYYKKRKQL